MELFIERQKLSPSTPTVVVLPSLIKKIQSLFMQVLPNCNCILNQEIIRAIGMVPNQGFGDHDRLEHSGPLASAGLISNGSGMDLGSWGGLQSDRLGISQASSMGWHGAPGVPISPVINKHMRLDIPVDNYPISILLDVS